MTNSISENIIAIPKEQTFDLPAGTFNAVISSVKVRTKMDGTALTKEVRILFEVDVPQITKKIPTAGATYTHSLRKGSDLRKLVELIKGPEFFDQHAGEGYNLEQLIGAQVELDLCHIQRPPYKNPMIVVCRIGLRKTEDVKLAA